MPKAFAEIVMNFIDAAGVDDICLALAKGKLKVKSTVVAREQVAKGRAALFAALEDLQATWAEEFATASGPELAQVIRATADGILLERRLSPRTQIVWTGPKVPGSYVRATREVVREIIRSAKEELLIVGYWIAGQGEGEGIVNDIIDGLSRAMVRGVRLTMVFDERKRPDGRDNRLVLQQLWPKGQPLPTLLTWHLPPDDKHIKLHAKVLIADRQDGLVTSANLTMYAMDKNMELGIRVVGTPASSVARHFTLLEAHGELAPM